MKERKLGLAKRLSAMALALVMVFSLLSLSDLKALAAGDTAPTLAEDWTYDGNGHDLIVAPGQALDDAYTVYYAVTQTANEPNAPTASNLGAWNFNWRDEDDGFVATDAGDYYIWWCAYDAEEDEFSTEVELADVVTVEKATPLGINPTGTTVEWKDDGTGAGAAQNLVTAPGGIPMNPAISTYYYTVTDADEDDPTNYTWSPYMPDAAIAQGAQSGASATDVDKYKVWYQLRYEGEDDDNYEDAEVSYVEAEITAKALVVTSETAAQETDYKGADGDDYDDAFAELTFNNSAGQAVAGVDVNYYAKEKDQKNEENVHNNINDAFIAVAGSKNFKAQDYTVYYTASLEGYETVKGQVTLTVEKAKATMNENDLNVPEVAAKSGANVQLIREGGAASDATKALAGDAVMYYQVNSSGAIPSKSGIGTSWKSEINDQKLIKGTGKWYVFYMVASKSNSNIEPSEIKYKTVTVYDEGEDVQQQGYATGENPAAAGNLVFNGDVQNLLAKNGVPGVDGATIQYFVSENDDTMPAANASGWSKLGSTENIKRKNAGVYTIWARIQKITDNGTVYAETTPVKVPAMIAPKNPVEVEDYTKPVDVENIEYTGRSQYLTTSGKGENNLYWFYAAYTDYGTANQELVYFGKTAPRMTDAGTYQVMAALIDPSYNAETEMSNYYAKPRAELLGQAVVLDMTNYNPQTGQPPLYGAEPVMVGYEVVIAKKTAELTVDPELVDDDLEYTGEQQSFIAKSGKPSSGNLYYLVVDEATDQIVSIDGTAVTAGGYTVYTMITEKSTFEVAMAVAQANLVAPYASTWGVEITPLQVLTEAPFALVSGESNIWADPAPIGNVTIEQIDPEALGVLPVKTPYTGHPQDIALEGVTGSESCQIYYMAYDENGSEVWDEWTRIVPRATEVGEYTIGYKVVNVEWNPDPNYTDETDEVKLEENSEITEGQAELLVAPVGLGLNATGLDQALVEEGLADNGIIMYALGTEEAPYPGVEWKAEVPEASEEGTYHVWYYVAGNEGFADTDPAHVDAVIGQETTLYRIFNSATGEHIYTYDANEVANATQNLGWTLDGTVSGTTAGTKPVYRLMDLIHGVHIYSTDDNEVQTLVAAGVAQLEGVQFYTVPQAEDTDDYYRLSSPDFPHHYTNDWNEINSLVESGVYTLDGYAWSFPGTSN